MGRYGSSLGLFDANDNGKSVSMAAEFTGNYHQLGVNTSVYSGYSVLVQIRGDKISALSS